jgi:hypothetical protein
MKGLQQKDFGQKQAKRGVYADLRILKGLGNAGKGARDYPSRIIAYGKRMSRKKDGKADVRELNRKKFVE